MAVESALFDLAVEVIEGQIVVDIDNVFHDGIELRLSVDQALALSDKLISAATKATAGGD